MDDQTLLKLAAKAAGIRLTSHIGVRNDYFADDKTSKEWNPLTDDGDALRLAVKLGINFHRQWQWNGYSTYTPERVIAGQQLNDSNHDDITSEQQDRHMSTWSVETYSEHNSDKAAATRRAIVRSAAEVGIGIKQGLSDDLPEDNYYKTQYEAEELGRDGEACEFHAQQLIKL